MTESRELVGAAFKDSAPMKTVEKIKGILAANGIKTKEVWHETKVPYCYALSVGIDDFGFSTNGKGLSPEFTLASAYGELMERLQLGFIGRKIIQKDGAYSANDSQDITVPVRQLLNKNLSWYEKMAQRLFDWNGTKVSAQQLLTQHADADGNIWVTPFYNLTDDCVAYLPSKMRKALYTSNGCAAGNTLEEALVQAISEIVERYYRIQILKDRICVPDVPEEVLQQYPTAYEIITYVRNQGYKVFVKDCSLGQSFPVVCVCYINEKTGAYLTHFGAYPDFEIALARALTETFQGRDLDSFTAYHDFLYSQDDVSFERNMYTELVYGCAERIPDFFVSDKTLAYNPNVGFSGKNNKELLKQCVDFFSRQGYSILVRNASCLGFPTCQVIIPGYSETAFLRFLKKTDEGRYLDHAIRTLRNPKQATLENMLGCLMHQQEMNTYAPKNKTGFLSDAKLMANLAPGQEDYLKAATMAYVHYALGQYGIASGHIQNMLLSKHGKEQAFLICTKRYVDLKAAGYPDEQIRKLLEMFHDEQTVARFYGFVDKKENPFGDFVLQCDLIHCDSCIIGESCRQKLAQHYIDMINEKTGQLNFQDSADYLKTLI